MPRRDIALLAELVAFDSTSRNSNLDVIAWLETYFARFGLTGTRSYDPSGTKANLWVTIGPKDQPGYVLSGHTDVVPVDGQIWETDPFTLTEKEGRLYGRGTCDMKGFLAACLARVPDMVAAPLKRPIHLCFSHDEEVGCIGVPHALRDLHTHVPVKPLAAFIGEPTSMQVVIGHKSKFNFRAEAKGVACHSSRMKQGVNAVDYAARLVVKIREMADRQVGQGLRDPLYDIPYSTIHTGKFSGGTALNIVPDAASVIFEFRMLPEEDHAPLEAELRAFAAGLDAEMKAEHPEAGFTLDMFLGMPGFDSAPEGEAARLAKRFANRNDHAKVAYSTEAGHFAHMAGIESIVVGPGNIEQAHGANEFIDIAEMDRCAEFLGRLIEAACA